MKNIIRKDIMIAGLFILLIMLPSADILLKLDRFKQLNENRELAQAPQFSLTINSIQKFPATYTKFFNDHFGFRKSLVRANFLIRHDFLGASPSNQVVVGKDGWLFYTGEGEMEDFRGLARFDKPALIRLAAKYEMKQKWLSQRGIRYLFVIAPNKSTIYGEFLPASYNRVSAKTGLDDLVEYLRRNTRVEVVDLRPSLLASKSQQRVYHKTDTHWNDYGAFVAYQAIMAPIQRWFPEVKAKAFNDYTIARKMTNGGDLSGMIGGTEFLREERIVFNPINYRKVKLDGIDDNKVSPVAIEMNNPGNIRAVVFRDSFLSAVIPFFTEHFDYAKYYWETWDNNTSIIEIVNSVRPDVIIEEIVERYIKNDKSDYNKQPPDFAIKGIFTNGVKIYDINISNNISHIEHNNEVLLKIESGRLIVNSTGNDPQIILPKIIVDNNKKYDSCIIKIDYSVELDNSMQLFYKTANNEPYSEDKSINKQIKKGNQEFYIKLPYTALNSKLRLDPLTTKGQIVINKIEIRAVSHGHDVTY